MKKEVKKIARAMQAERYELCYENVTNIVGAHIEAIGKELAIKKNRDVIKSVSRRLKTPESIYEKLKKKELENSFQMAKHQMSDLIGLRIVVMFLDDVYEVAELLKSISELTLITEKDYIKEPKRNGYSSLHLIFKIPTYHGEEIRTERLEIQIRTMAMDCWSALDHQMVYKKSSSGMEDIKEELLKYSMEIAAMDRRMLEIRDLIDGQGPKTKSVR